MTPAKIRSVARPRIRGPSDISPTLATASSDDADRLGASRAPSGATSRLARRAEVVGLLADHAAAERAAARAGAGLDPLGLLQLAGRCGPCRRRCVGAHAASSALSWDATISW